MAGLGRRTFAPGEVLTATNVMGYLQDQAVMNFAGTAARGSAIGTAISEGMVSYLADNNFVQAYDGTGWRSIGGVQVASGTATRDALLPSPIQGDKVFRTDLGFEQTYYTAAGTANPGGRASAGWYDNQRNMGLVPIVPPTVNYSGGTATANTLGEVSFTAVNAISFNNAFTATYKNYRIIFKATNTTNGSGCYFRFRAAGTDRSTNYYYGGYGAREGGAAQQWNGLNTSNFDMCRLHANQTHFIADVISPEVSTLQSNINYQFWGIDGTGGLGISATGGYSLANSNDGFSISNGGGSMTGTVQLFGYNS